MNNDVIYIYSLGAATLTVDIINLNDNPPRFDVNFTMVSVPEELIAPQNLLTLQVSVPISYNDVIIM